MRIIIPNYTAPVARQHCQAIACLFTDRSSGQVHALATRGAQARMGHKL